MRTLTLLLIALAVAGNAVAQRRARIGPTVSTISIDAGSGSSQSFTSFGGTFALLSGDDGEIGVAVSRYNDLSNNNCVRNMTFFGVESNYYPVRRDRTRGRLRSGRRVAGGLPRGAAE